MSSNAPDLIVLQGEAKDDRFIIPRPRDWASAVEVAMEHFPSVRAYPKFALKTNDPPVCKGIMTEITQQSWPMVGPDVTTLHVHVARAQGNIPITVTLRHAKGMETRVRISPSATIGNLFNLYHQWKTENNIGGWVDPDADDVFDIATIMRCNGLELDPSATVRQAGLVDGVTVDAEEKYTGI